MTTSAVRHIKKIKVAYRSRACKVVVKDTFSGFPINYYKKQKEKFEMQLQKTNISKTKAILQLIVKISLIVSATTLFVQPAVEIGFIELKLHSAIGLVLVALALHIELAPAFVRSQKTIVPNRRSVNYEETK